VEFYLLHAENFLLPKIHHPTFSFERTNLFFRAIANYVINWKFQYTWREENSDKIIHNTNTSHTTFFNALMRSGNIFFFFHQTIFAFVYAFYGNRLSSSKRSMGQRRRPNLGICWMRWNAASRWRERNGRVSDRRFLYSSKCEGSSTFSYSRRKSSVIARGADFIKLSSPFPRNRNLWRYRRRWKVNIKAEEKRERISPPSRYAMLR